MMDGPRQLDLRVWAWGRSLPLWCYDTLPEGARLARTTDLKQGRDILYKVLVGPDEGKYYTDYVRPSVSRILIDRINAGYEVWVVERR